MPGAQADQVVQVGAAAVDPVLDVVQVHPAGLAARVPAPAVVPFAGGAADRGAGPAAAPAQGQDLAGVAVGHPGQRGGAGEHLGGGHADRRAVFDVAAGRVRRVPGDPRRGRRRFRGNAGLRGRGRGRRPGEDAGAGVHHDLVDLRVVGPGDLPGQERLRDRDQPVSQLRRRRDHRPARVRPARVRRVRRARVRAVRGGRRLRSGGRLRSGRRSRGGGRFHGGGRFRGNARGRPGRLARQVGAGGAQRLEQHRARPAAAGGTRRTGSRPPRTARSGGGGPGRSCHWPGVTWRWARANRSSWFAVIGPASSASPASVAGVAIRVSARTLA